MIKACCDKCGNHTIVEHYAPKDWLVCEECMDEIKKDEEAEEVEIHLLNGVDNAQF